jgi:hypothetical protein
MYYKQIVDTLVGVLSRFKGVNYVRYTGDDLINQQNNNKPIQCWIDNISLSQYNLTTNINKMSFEVYILGFADGTSGNTVLDVQDVCYNVAVNFLTYIDNMPQFQNLISLYDWSILTLDRFSDDSNAGVKLSVVLNAVSPINLCEFESWFNDEPYQEEPDHEIDVNNEEIGDIEINPITLPRNRIC